jgi:general secretion pathway protein L
MPDRLLLRLSHDGGLCWLRQPAGARSPATSVPGDPPASAIAGAREIVVFVPSAAVLLTTTRLSARNRAQLQQALPFAVEDQLLDPVEELHFAASRGEAEVTGVAVVARRTMQAWLDRLSEAGVRPDVLLPEALALRCPADGAVAMIEDTQATVRLAQWSAFACSLPELPDWLTQLQAVDTLPPLSVLDFRAESASMLALPAVVAGPPQRQRDSLALLAAQFQQTPLNLLDGEFAARHRGARGARGWKVAALLAAAAVALALANLGLDVLRLSRASTRMDTLAQEAVRTAFPDVDAAQLGRLGPEQLMRGRLERLRGDADAGGLLHMLTAIGPVLGSTRGIQTRGMEYRNGTLELSLRAPDVGALDSVRERLATMPGVKAEVTAVNPGDDGVDGRIRIGDSGGVR